MFDCRFPQKILQKIPNKNDLRLNKEETDFVKGLFEENFFGAYNHNNNYSNFVGILPRFKTHLSNNFNIQIPPNELYSKIDEVLKLHSQKGHVSLMKLKELLRNEIGKNLSKSTLSRILRNKLGYRYRKTTLKNKKIGCKNNILSSFLFIKVIVRSMMQNLEIIYIDESGVKIDNKHFRTWINKGYNFGLTSGETGKTNLLMAVSKEKVVYYEMNRENINGNVFLNFINKLYDRVDSFKRNKLLFIMDNATFHRTEENIHNFKNKGIRILFNSPYKSEFNPIEYVFRHLKNYIYKKIFSTLEEVENFVKEIVIDKINSVNLLKICNSSLREYENYQNKYYDLELN